MSDTSTVGYCKTSELEAVRLSPKHPCYKEDFPWASRKSGWDATYDVAEIIDDFVPMTDGRIISQHRTLELAMRHVK